MEDGYCQSRFYVSKVDQVLIMTPAIRTVSPCFTFKYDDNYLKLK